MRPRSSRNRETPALQAMVQAAADRECARKPGEACDNWSRNDAD
jgi:hypothetical protein